MPRREPALAAGALVLLALPLLAWGWGGLSRTGLPLALSITLLALVAGVAYRDYVAGEFDFFQPVLWFGLLFFLPGFVLKTWHILVLGPDSAWLRKFTDWDYHFNLALATAVLSYLCLALGYYLFPFGRQAQRFLAGWKSRRLNPRGLKWPAFGLFLVGVASSFYLLRTGGLGYTDFRESGALTHVIQHIGKYNLYALFIFLWALITARAWRQPSWLALLGVMACCQVALGFLVGSRGYLFLNGLVTLAALSYSGWLRGRPGRLVWPACLIVLLLFVGMIFVTPFREAKNRLVGFDRPATVGEAASLYRDIATDHAKEGAGQGLGYFFELITGRANNMEALAIVLERAGKVQHLERAYGIDNNMWLDFTWGLVPRFLYPDKPIISEFAVKFGQIYHDLPPRMRSWSNPTIMGDLYRNLGYIGILAGMLVLGMLLRWLYLTMVQDTSNPLFFVAYFFSIMGLNFEGTYIGLFHALVRLWIMLAVFAGLVMWQYKGQAGAVPTRWRKPSKLANNDANARVRS